MPPVAIMTAFFARIVIAGFVLSMLLWRPVSRIEGRFYREVRPELSCDRATRVAYRTLETLGYADLLLADLPTSDLAYTVWTTLVTTALLIAACLPLALPDIVAGLRIASTSTVGLATLAVFAGAGGLGSEIIAGSNITFKTGVVAAGGLAVLLAVTLDVILLTAQYLLTPWRRARAT